MIKGSETGKFATLFYSILNTESGQLNFIIAGHNNILHFKNFNQFDIYKSADIPLGIYDDYIFEEKSLKIEPGDFILIYSDGITEAEDENENLFGEDRLIEIIQKNINASPNDLIESIYKHINLYSKGRLQNDDQTLLLIKIDAN